MADAEREELQKKWVQEIAQDLIGDINLVEAFMLYYFSTYSQEEYVAQTTQQLRTKIMDWVEEVEGPILPDNS